jgi:hypothetical protein
MFPQIVLRSPKILLFFLRPATFKHPHFCRLPYIFCFCPSLRIFSLVFPFMHPTFFVHLPFSLPFLHFPCLRFLHPSSEKPLVSPFPHSISIPSIDIFLYPTLLLSFPFFLLSLWFLVSSVSLILVLTLASSIFSLLKFYISSLICCLLFPSPLHPVISMLFCFSSSPFQPCYSLRHVVFLFLQFLFSILKFFPKSFDFSLDSWFCFRIFFMSSFIFTFISSIFCSIFSISLPVFFSTSGDLAVFLLAPDVTFYPFCSLLTILKLPRTT